MKKICCGNNSETAGKFRRPVILLLLIMVLFPLSSCGKKSAPTLKEYAKPAQPTLLRAIHREDKVILQWNYPGDREKSVADFIILKSSGGEFKKLVHIENSKRAYEDTDFQTGRDYRYKVIAQSFKGVYSDESNILDITPLSAPPPPSNLSFAIKGGSLFISWEPAEKDLLYNVYKSPEKGKYGLLPLNSAPVSGSSFAESFDINKKVYYVVRSLRATKILDEGTRSGELEVDPSALVPAALKNVKYLAVADKVFLYWDIPEESWVNSFRIYRKTEGQDYLLIGETQTPAFTDNEPPLTKRDYRLSAVGPGKEGHGKEGPTVEIRDVIYKAPPE